MSAERERELDLGSLAVIGLTLALFIAALFVKGFTHDLLLEAGVFLVSVKLIMLSFKNEKVARHTEQHLEEILASVRRMEDRAAAGGQQAH